MAVKAIAKGVRISPRKVGVVAALVRGRTVADAVTILEHVPRRAPALAIKKAVQSAAANAENNHNLKPGTLNIVEIGNLRPTPEALPSSCTRPCAAVHAPHQPHPCSC
jgi:large subunit ribosomal protein L22